MLIDWESEEQLAAAVHGGPAGEASLLAAASTVAVVAALGEATGPSGVPFLRDLVADLTADPELRCAALVALAKRSGPGASDLLAEALYDGDDSVRNYALVALSCVGDDRAVDHVHALLALDLTDGERHRLPFAMQYMSIPAVTYLLRHAESRAREDELASLVRANLPRLGKVERDWLTVFWPDTVVDPPTGNRPHATDMVAWQPLLATIYPR
ncbi:HEAT repeat-containing protein [Asanoa hainanensis]|uniref:HEAT repeat-containing protein n=1 Tax=Asanoa hainanensis TaxID=560556 RepID=A0A239IV45_9ACTN|nr:HEAT repeat domain-containing protein [Asanoa hainanensis]SNS97467.1 HEAT repeat-containing protein [Asanoa hainanensis]